MEAVMTINQINLNPVPGQLPPTNSPNARGTEGVVEGDELFGDGTVNPAVQTYEIEAEGKVNELNKLNSIGESLGLELEGVELADDLDDITEYIQKLDAMLVKVEAVIEEKQRELVVLQAEQTALRSDETAQKVRLEKLNSELSSKQEEMEEINNTINQMQEQNELAQAEYNSQYESQRAAAEKEFNPDTDGDFEAFIAKKLSNLGGPNLGDTSSLQSEYNSISTDTEDLSRSINVIATQTLPNVQHKLRTVGDKITNVEHELNTAIQDKETINTEKAAMPKKAVDTIKSYVPEEEWKIIEDNNIDLSAKLEDGSPKFLITKGSRDKKYHIYERGGADWSYAASIARTYCEDGGYNIVSNGNGHIQYYQSTGGEDKEGSFNAVFFNMPADESSVTWNKEKATYKTYSPLAFDLDNNGIKTSDEKIMFDINGDGKLDEINDVMEGILAFDKDGDGIVGSDGSELFGNNTDLDGDGIADGYKDGFEALKALAYKEGFINGMDDMVLDETDLDALMEKYGLSMKTGGYNSEAVSLKSLGITQINLANTSETTLTDNFDGKHNQLMKQEGATFVQNGTEKDYVDVWNAVEDK